jgi:hypothetical protein
MVNSEQNKTMKCGEFNQTKWLMQFIISEKIPELYSGTK